MLITSSQEIDFLNLLWLVCAPLNLPEDAPSNSLSHVYKQGHHHVKTIDDTWMTAYPGK
jgi:hypothetical protein